MLHTFRNDPDGATPYAGLIMDGNGALYGTTSFGGSHGAGTVYRLTPPAAGQTSWTETVLHNFSGNSDGVNPDAGLIMDGNGALYGTTANGGVWHAGTVFRLTPPAPGQATWTKTALHNFKNNPDGATPLAGLIMDGSGALYGTTSHGGSRGDGTVFKLMPPAAGQAAWTETVLHVFRGAPDGANPVAGLTTDGGGTLYGTTANGGSKDFGAVYKLTPPATGQTAWTETVVHAFRGAPDGANPVAGLIMSGGGAFYGTTRVGGDASGQGTVFKLVP